MTGPAESQGTGQAGGSEPESTSHDQADALVQPYLEPALPKGPLQTSPLDTIPFS